ncbi:MAG: ABC transporter ATP-binding protein [Desulfovibrio sp.]|nr:ABC transporter ATP-binding protein [Desulfovibrio sp.]
MASVTFTHVCKRFGDTEVIRNISLDIHDGEFMVLVGPSGCGKSTLLRLLSGLEKPDSGALRIGGRDVADHAPQDRNVAMVFQNYALFPHMNVARNISYGMMVRGVPRQEREHRMRETAGKLGLDDYLDRLPRELSGGQRQRVAMARALVRNPCCLLMDEPLSNLDAQLRIQVRGEIKRLQHRLKLTTIYVTHDQTEAMSMADRVAVLRDGRVEQVGPPLQVFEQPSNLFTACFIGQPRMNVLAATRVDGVRYRVEDAADMHLPAPLADRLGGRERLALGVRCGKVRIGGDTGRDSVTFQAKVLLTEPLGEETLVHFSLGSSSLVAMTGRRETPSEGSSASVSFRLSDIHFFDPDSTQCLVHAGMA